jgi:hypothetical protein
LDGIKLATIGEISDEDGPPAEPDGITPSAAAVTTFETDAVSEYPTNAPHATTSGKTATTTSASATTLGTGLRSKTFETLTSNTTSGAMQLTSNPAKSADLRLSRDAEK